MTDSCDLWPAHWQWQDAVDMKQATDIHSDSTSEDSVKWLACQQSL